MVDEFAGQAGLIVNDESDAVGAGNVFGRDDYEFVPCDPCTEGDLLDLATRDLAANGGSVQHVGQNHVVHVLRLSGHLLATFLAWNRLADDSIIRHASRPFCDTAENPKVPWGTWGWDSV